MEHKLLVLCDAEEDYAQHMAEFLGRSKELPWEIAVYTEWEELQKLEKPIDVLLISETVYAESLLQLQANLLIVLNESGMPVTGKAANINKYQSAEAVKKEILELYMKQQDICFFRQGEKKKTRLIGMYTPVHRCLQTTFALTYGQLLAQKHRTLYLTFEYYAGNFEWLDGTRKDLSELLYFLQTEEKGFYGHLQAVVQHLDNLDFVAPMINGQNMLYITVKEWMKLLSRLTELGEYEYIILDLSESMQGLFEILRLCDRIYTIVKEDTAARGKLARYEQLLTLQDYEDVKKKSAKCSLPMFRKLPEEIGQYTRGELAEYIRELLYREEWDEICGT